MSRIYIEQINAVFEEYEQVREAVSQRLRDRSYAGHGHLKRAENNLETTYTVRLFVEFEGILRLVLLIHDPRQRVSREAYNRINRAARLFSIPDFVRDNVHQARSVLNRFLKPLP